MLAWLRVREDYEKLASAIRRVLEADPTFPAESVYTIRYRLKDEKRLVEKITEKNKKRAKTTKAIGAANFKERIEDLLGVRIVCLRLSDVDKVDAYLKALRDEGKLGFVGKPSEKKTFVLPLDPKERQMDDVDLQYSGYSSIHYIVRAGRGAVPAELSRLKAEIQLRTLLEEAWGELDHVRYELKRSGNVKVPEHISRGFYVLGAQLATMAVEAEYLSRDLDTIIAAQKPVRRPARRRKPPKAPSPPATSAALPEPTTLKDVVVGRLNVIPTERTLAYLERRISEHEFILGRQRRPSWSALKAVLTPEIVNQFQRIYTEETGATAFERPDEANVDAILVANFAMFSEDRPEVAEQQLRFILRTRKRPATIESTR